MKLYFLLGIALLAVFVNFQIAYGQEVIANPTQTTFGPDEWIEIDVEIIDYIGGPVLWTAEKPDGSTESGEFSDLKASKKRHVFSRSAFDNLFGTWNVEYIYNNVTKLSSFRVAPLVVEIITDKQVYIPGETATIFFGTNLYEPQSAKAESYVIEILDKFGDPLDHIAPTTVKAIEESTQFEFEIDRLLKYHPPNEYRIQIQYYNHVVTHPITIADETVQQTLYLSSNKPAYEKGEEIEINLIVHSLVENTAHLIITDPQGKKYTNSIVLDSLLTRIHLTDLPRNIPGTYTYEIEYGQQKETSTFEIIDDFVPATKQSAEVSLILDKKTYRPGEMINAEFEISEITTNALSYWFEDLQGNKGLLFTKDDVNSGSYIINHRLPVEQSEEILAMHVVYADLEVYALFIVEGEPVFDVSTTVESTQKTPIVVTTIDDADVGLNKISDITTDEQNNLYVLDSEISKIKIFDSQGNFQESFGEIGSEPGQMTNPQGILFHSGMIYVADYGNLRVQVFDKDGTFQKEFGNSRIKSQSLINPENVAIDSDDVAYVADSGLSKISKYYPDKSYAGHVESIETAKAKFVSAQALGLYGNQVNILSTGGNRVLQFAADGTFLNSFGSTGEDEGQFNRPTDIAIAKNGDIYVADAGNNRIQVFNNDGKFLEQWGSFGNKAGQFSEITAVTVDSSGDIWVSETNRIQKFSLSNFMEQILLPDWIKNNAGWWADGQIENSDFLLGVQFLIKQNIISVPSSDVQSEQTEDDSTQVIPAWIKNNAKWWSEGRIDNETFVGAIQYLVNNGIIVV